MLQAIACNKLQMLTNDPFIDLLCEHGIPHMYEITYTPDGYADVTCPASPPLNAALEVLSSLETTNAFSCLFSL